MRRFRSRQATLEQGIRVMSLSVPIVRLPSPGIAVTATVRIDILDTAGNIISTRTAEGGECEVMLLTQPTGAPYPGAVIDRASTILMGLATVGTQVVFTGFAHIWAKHLESGAIVGRTFEVEYGTYVEGTLTDQVLINPGTPMPSTFNQPRLEQPAAQAYGRVPRVQWTGRGWRVD